MNLLRRLFFDSQRREDRVAVSNSCYIKLPEGTLVSVRLKDLSLNGMSFEFSPATPVEDLTEIQVQIHTLNASRGFLAGRIVSQDRQSGTSQVRYFVEFLVPLKAEEMQIFLSTHGGEDRGEDSGEDSGENRRAA
jgi:hypothetical protein